MRMMGFMGSEGRFRVFWSSSLPPQCYLEGEKVTFSECLLHPKSILPTAFLLLYLTLSRNFDEKAGAQRGEVTCPGSQLWGPNPDPPSDSGVHTAIPLPCKSLLPPSPPRYTEKEAPSPYHLHCPVPVDWAFSGSDRSLLSLPSLDGCLSRPVQVTPDDHVALQELRKKYQLIHQRWVWDETGEEPRMRSLRPCACMFLKVKPPSVLCHGLSCFTPTPGQPPTSQKSHALRARISFKVFHLMVSKLFSKPTFLWKPK